MPTTLPMTISKRSFLRVYAVVEEGARFILAPSSLFTIEIEKTAPTLISPKQPSPKIRERGVKTNTRFFRVLLPSSDFLRIVSFNLCYSVLICG